MSLLTSVDSAMTDAAETGIDSIGFDALWVDVAPLAHNSYDDQASCYRSSCHSHMALDGSVSSTTTKETPIWTRPNLISLR